MIQLLQHVYSVLLVIAADLCLTQSPSTPLETSHAAFVTEMAHRARMIMSLRGLDTGAARDVSGVLRIVRGAGNWHISVDGEGAVEERECLYYVATDGGVKVFEGGASA